MTRVVVTMFVTIYDMLPVTDSVSLLRLTACKTHAVAAVDRPDREVEIKVRAREVFENGERKFKIERTVAED